MYKDVATLFNRKPGSRGQGDLWYPTVLRNVNLNADRAAIMAKYGTESTDNAMLMVRYQRIGDEIFVEGKPWANPKEWDQTEDSLTFTSGTAFDFFWEGEWLGGIASDSDYGDEGFYNYMNRTKDHVFAITSVAKLSLLPHFEIMGK